MSIERDLVVPGIMQRGGRWAVFSANGPGYALAARSALGPDAEISVFEREKRAAERLASTLAAADSSTSNMRVQQGSVTTPQDLKELDGVIAAQVLHDIPLERQQAALALLVTYLRHVGSLLVIEAEQARGSLRIRYPVNYESFEYFAGLIELRDVRRVAIAPTGMWSTAYAALGFSA
jgi:hypothetical protein